MQTPKEVPKKERIFSEETMETLENLGEVLERIHNRLLKEGKVKVVNGEVIFLDQENPK